MILKSINLFLYCMFFLSNKYYITISNAINMAQRLYKTKIYIPNNYLISLFEAAIMYI